MKKLFYCILITIVFVTFQACDKESGCGCDSKGVLAENVSATVINYGDYVFILDNAVNDNTVYVVCGNMPDSLRKDSLKVNISGYFKKYCYNPSVDRLGHPMTLTKINIK